jgi:lysophospholipase L1-like esterase
LRWRHSSQELWRFVREAQKYSLEDPSAGVAIEKGSEPDKLAAAYDSGDHLHPSDAGYIAMSKAFKLSLFSDFK